MTVELIFRGHAHEVRSEMAEMLAVQVASVTTTAEADAAARAKGENIDGTERRETVVAAERPRRGRKPATVADLPADVVAEAEAAGVHVSDQLGGGKPDTETVTEETKPAEGQGTQPDTETDKALTETDIRNAIIDVLNAVQAKHPDDPDIRTKTLKPLLEGLGAAKISAIAPERYADVPALLAEIKAKEGIE